MNIVQRTIKSTHRIVMHSAQCTVHNISEQCTLHSTRCFNHKCTLWNIRLTVQFIMFKENLTALYPNIPCDVFKKFSASSKEIGQTSHGYVPHSLKTHVQGNIYNLSGNFWAQVGLLSSSRTFYCFGYALKKNNDLSFQGSSLFDW